MLRPLRVEDSEALWRFEIANRAWFEAHLGPRPDSYWELGSLRCIIAAQVLEPDTLYLIWKGDVLIGRLGLTGRAHGVAQLALRLGQDHVGQGHGGCAVALALDEARALGLWSVEARVGAKMPAAERLLASAGFRLIPGADAGQTARLFCRDLD